MIIFETKDVLTLAKTVKENAEYIDEAGDYGRDEHGCRFCFARLEVKYYKGYSINHKEFKHDLDCPYLISLDVLTRPPKED